MSFVITNAQSYFIDLMNRVFTQYLAMFIKVFIYDILDYSRSEHDHVDHLKIVLYTLRNLQLFAKFSKCKFWVRLVAFLVHIIYGNSFRVDPQKTEVVRNCPRPISLSDIWSFLGLATITNYC